MASQKVYFSNYIDTNNITTKPEITSTSRHRYYIKIPFINRPTGKTAIVIMKNPSIAGKKDANGQLLSDNTIYKVCDYLYKSQTPVFKEVIILNLMSIFGGTFSNILTEITSLQELSTRLNTYALDKILSNSNDDTVIIAAWGSPPSYSETEDSHFTRKELHLYYHQRIQSVLNILNNKTVYKVGNLSNEKYPKHGAYWYDYELFSEYEF